MSCAVKVFRAGLKAGTVDCIRGWFSAFFTNGIMRRQSRNLISIAYLLQFISKGLMRLVLTQPFPSTIYAIESTLTLIDYILS